jgi:hypothetical protein
MTPFQAKFIIECLRAGIASSPVSELFSRGQTRLVQAFQEHLNAGGGAMAIEGGYGQGKTHLLKHLAQIARRRGFVVSLVTLSKETPFHHWWHLYGQAIAQAERPDSGHDPGLGGLLRRLKWSDEAIQSLHAFGDGLHPRLKTALRCYYESHEGEVRHRVLGDLMGHALTNGELGRIHRSVTGERVRLPAARLAQTGQDYFAFAGKLFQLAGYAGWVILFDEFELVCKLSALQRARAYANLAAFRRAAERPGWERTLTVVAFIPGMVTDYLLGGPADLGNLPNTLRVRGLEEEAAAAEESIRWLIEQKHSLSLLGEADTLAVLDQIAGLHQTAYGWRLPAALAASRFYAPATSAAERMRTKVRFCVEALDLAYLYGEAPAIQTQEAALPQLAEDPALFAGASEEVVVEEVDR